VSSQSRSAARSQFIPARQSIRRLSPRSQYPTALQIRWNSNQNDLSPLAAEKEQKNQDIDAQEKEAEVANTPESAPSNVRGQQKPQEKTTEALKIKIPPNETVYIGNLFYDVTAEDLRKRMEKYGTVLNTMIAHDNRGLSKG
jgi:RNA recognition motif-containing protein